MLGLFQENGPCFITPDGKPRNNPYSWTSATNMLYIDQPTQVGFSYSIPIPASMDASGDIVPLQGKSCPQNATKCGTWSLPDANLTASSTPDAAPNFWKTLQGFMGVFPQYAQNDVIFGTESYGGKYGPIFSEYIMKQNDILEQDDTAIPGALQVPLSALLIGNGWFDPLVQYQAYYNFTVSPGNTYDLHVFNSSTQTAIYNALYRPGGCVDMINTCYTNGTDVNCAAADDACYRGAEQPFEDMTLARDSYDVRYLNPSPFPPSWMDAYLN
jgi:carboxypeptidase C (cathepsin A)